MGVRYALEEFSMAKRETILSDFHEDKIESAPGGSSEKPKVAHEESQVSPSEPVATPQEQTKKTKDVKGSEKKNRSSS
jgi:hypothetical protein